MFPILFIILLHSAFFDGTDGFTVTQQNEWFELSIIHLNDFHARFAQTSPTSGICHKDKENQCIGGLGRVMTVTRQLLKERINPIFLNAGDMYQGTMWYNVFKWNATVHFMNMLPHDAMTLGNHDFDHGAAGLVPFLQRFRAPVLLANVDASEEPTMQGLYKNSTVIVRDNQMIGVIGVVTTDVEKYSKPGKLKILDEIQSINAEAKRLKAKGVNIIIVLSHVGLYVDRVIAAKCPDIDVIVGGHTHTLLYSGKPESDDVPKDKYPVVVKQNTTNRTVIIVQAGAYTKYLGNLTVWFDEQGEVADWEGNPIFLANSIEQDPEMIEELRPWAKVIDAITERVVGETRSFINGSCFSPYECTMADLITDAMVHTYRSKADSAESWTYAAIGCIHGGGVRSDIAPGQITFGDLATVLPSEGTFDLIELKGDDIYSALEDRVSPNGRFLHWSGIKVVYNMSLPVGSRVQNLSVRCQACKIPIYEPLDHDKWYRVVAISHLVNEKSGLVPEKHRNRQVGPLDVSAFEEYVKSISPFTYELDQRVQIFN